MTDYVLKTGEAGATRLDVIEEFYGPASRAFLRDVGLRPGLRVLDVGCGTGTLTSFIAEEVGERGHVVAADVDDEQLRMAAERARERGLSNMEFVRLRVGVDALPAAGFDLVHCRLVLMHVPNARAALHAMSRALRPGGLLVCEETSASSALTSPRCEAVERMNGWFVALGRSRRLDFDLGDKLFALVHEYVSRRVASRYVQPMVPLLAAQRFLELAAAELRPALLASKIASEADADGALRSLQAFHPSGAAYYAPGRMAQVAGLVAG